MSRYIEFRKYASMSIWARHKQIEASDSDREMYEAVLELAQRSIPVLPTRYEEVYGTEAFCPRCDNDLDLSVEPYYCEHCGQAIDWSEVD